jgi:hypothetical protein
MENCPDNCPTCGKRITDVDEGGCEAPNGQRYCIDHLPDDVREEILCDGMAELDDAALGFGPARISRCDVCQWEAQVERSDSAIELEERRHVEATGHDVFTVVDLDATS